MHASSATCAYASILRRGEDEWLCCRQSARHVPGWISLAKFTAFYPFCPSFPALDSGSRAADLPGFQKKTGVRVASLRRVWHDRYR